MDGGGIANEGEKKMTIWTEDSQPRLLTMQVCDVNKALMSVSKVSRAGHRVVFDDDYSYIENKMTGERTTLKQENGVYTLEVWVQPHGSYGQGFGRQG